MVAVAGRAGPVIDRVRTGDLVFLAMDTGPVPQQIGAVLLLSPCPPGALPAVEAAFRRRISAIPRLRQRLAPVPPGCGRPIWLEQDFDVRRHVRHVTCPVPGDEQVLLDIAIDAITRALPRSRPLWEAVFVTGLAGDAAALVIVMHHVLADGLGGLAILATLADPDGVVPYAPQSPAAHPGPPAPRPSAARLAADALRGRVLILARLPRGVRNLRMSMRAGGGLAPVPAAACSLLRPTGPRRRLAVVHADLAEVRRAAHRCGATVNDAVLTAVSGALHRLLAARGESLDSVAVAVPVAGRGSAATSELGNQVAPLLVTVPGSGDPRDRLRQIAGAVRARKAAATGPPPIAVLGSVFRVAARLRLYRWYMNHQRRLHTLVSNVRGPQQPIRLGGAPVARIIPVAAGETGNLTVSFDVLSYAGTLTITAIVDPDQVPDMGILGEALRAELALLTSGAAGS